MYNKENLDTIFFENNDLSKSDVEKIVSDSLSGAEDGELYMQSSENESFAFDDGKLKIANSNKDIGFGLRSLSGEVVGYAHASEISKKALERAGKTVKEVITKENKEIDVSPQKTNRNYYEANNPIPSLDFDKKIKILQNINEYARSINNKVEQVSINLASSWEAIRILRSDGEMLDDIRPLVRLGVNIAVTDNGKMETGSYGSGGRHNYDILLSEENWKYHVDEALKQALIMLEAKPAPAGEMTVVLGPGWPGILLHEAIGHGLEGDFNRKKTSVFSHLMGEKVATNGVTVVDDGTLHSKRGSLSIDDEGTPTEKTILIDNGKLVGYMHDRLNARLMGTKSTGNGRRQSYAHQPMPRMRNTIMVSGDKDPKEILESTKSGIYAKSFAGGQVDITNGKFVFSASEAYKIEDGKITSPVKGATLIGSGFEVLKKVTMIGNNMELDPGIGTCGKNGQGVPVGVGQPTLKIDGLTVGGTETN
ncbi:MAG: Metalloprotease TldD [Alphaproteobacteria bacterium MarineAlpha9_Bin3]|nr:MAG: Metalloprotease TldD [Alphaproteobacteria bacterium MarineAlpha9_Bin3]|tara:strand:+ start:14049 stop:15485 length:1437 start_codon:yes stop_codon:yes gene_type:complete